MHSYLQGHPELIEAVRRLEELNADQFELYFLKKSSTQIAVKNQEVDSLTRSEDVGLSIRLIRDRKMGFSYTTSLEPRAIERAVSAAFEIAQAMPEDPFNQLHAFGSTVYPEIDTFDPKSLQVPLQKKIDLARFMESECRKQDRRIQGIRQATLNESVYETHLVDSHGEHLQHKSTLFTSSITCKSEGENESQVGHEFAFSNDLESLDVSRVGKDAARLATELLGAKQPPTMKCPAIFRNSVVAEFLDFLAPSFSAEAIEKGRSILAGKEGQRLFSESFSLIDDGLMAGGYSTSPFDGEGFPSTETYLVDSGFVTGFLYDGYYARKKGKTPTGSAARSIQSPPSISTSNLYLPRGKKAPEELLAGISQGILITDLMGVHTANPVTGDFSLGASGILIENGSLTRPVRGFAVAGNILDVLRSITEVGNDLRFFGGTGAPSVRIRELSVGGS